MGNATERDLQLLTIVWQCFKSPVEVDTTTTISPIPRLAMLTILQIDFEKLAELGGYKTKASANTAYWGLKKKLLNGGTTTTTSPTKKTPKKRSATDDSADTPAPMKRGRKSKAEIAAMTVETNDDEESEKEVKVKKEERRDSMEGLLSGAKQYLAGGEDDDEV